MRQLLNIANSIDGDDKLKIFEMDFIKSCKKRSLKTKLRKAKDLLEVFEVTIEIFRASN